MEHMPEQQQAWIGEGLFWRTWLKPATEHPITVFQIPGGPVQLPPPIFTALNRFRANALWRASPWHVQCRESHSEGLHDLLEITHHCPSESLFEHIDGLRLAFTTVTGEHCRGFFDSSEECTDIFLCRCLDSFDPEGRVHTPDR